MADLNASSETIALSNILMANSSVHDLDILHQDSFNSTKPNTGAIDVDTDAIGVDNQELEELENTSFRSCIPTNNDRYDMLPPIDTVDKDSSLPGIIDVSTVIGTERGIPPILTFENDVDFNFSVHSVMDLDIQDLTDWNATSPYTGYDEISDVKSGISSDASTEASSLLFNVWNEDYEGNPDPEMMKKLIAAKYLPKGIDPTAECQINREKILLQLRTIEDDDSSQGSCHVFLRRHWLARYLCGLEENSDCDSMMDSIVDTVIVVDDNGDAESVNSFVIQDLDFKKPKTSQYALIPDNKYRPGMEMIDQELVLMLPKNATLKRYEEITNPYLPVQRVVRIEDEEDDPDPDGRESRDGYYEKEMEFTLQKYDSTPQRIAELVMAGKFSEAKSYSISNEKCVSEPIDLTDYIIKERRIPVDDDYVEADRSIASTVESEDDEDISWEGTEDNLSCDSCIQHAESEAPDLSWDEEIVMATLVPAGLLSDDKLAILLRGGIVPAGSDESDLTYQTIPQPQDDEEIISEHEEQVSNPQRERILSNDKCTDTNTKKEKHKLSGDYEIDKQYADVKAVYTSDTSVSSADMLSIDRLSVERKEGYILPNLNLTVASTFEPESLELENNYVYPAKEISAPSSSGEGHGVHTNELAAKLKECTGIVSEASVSSIPTEAKNISGEENAEDAKDHPGILHANAECKSYDLLITKDTVLKSVKQHSENLCQQSETNKEMINQRQNIESSTTGGNDRLDSQDNLSILKRDEHSNNITDTENINITTDGTNAEMKVPLIEDNNDIVKASNNDTAGKTSVVSTEVQQREHSSSSKSSCTAATISNGKSSLQETDFNATDEDARASDYTSNNTAPDVASACGTFLLSVSKTVALQKTKRNSNRQSPKALSDSESKSVIDEGSFKERELFTTAKFSEKASVYGEGSCCPLDDSNGEVETYTSSPVGTKQSQTISELLDITYENSSNAHSRTDETSSINMSKILEITYDECLSNTSQPQTPKLSNIIKKKMGKTQSTNVVKLDTEQRSSLSKYAKNISSPRDSFDFRETEKMKTNKALNDKDKISTEQVDINNELSLLKMAMVKRRALSQSGRIRSAPNKMTNNRLELLQHLGKQSLK